MNRLDTYRKTETKVNFGNVVLESLEAQRKLESDGKTLKEISSKKLYPKKMTPRIAPLDRVKPQRPNKLLERKKFSMTWSQDG